MLGSSDKDYKYQFINRKKISSNSRFNIFFDHVISPDKKEIKDFLIIKPKVLLKDKIVGICILPLYKDKFCLMNGWRHQLNQFVIQAPAGFVEEDEEPEDTALRELKEETIFNCDKSNLISLGSYLPDAGLIEGRVALFLALKCKLLDKNLDKEFGTGELVFYTKKELNYLIQNSSNIGGSSLMAAFRALNKISSLG